MDRQMERGRDRVENRAEDAALFHSLALPCAKRGGLCFPRGPALPMLCLTEPLRVFLLFPAGRSRAVARELEVTSGGHTPASGRLHFGRAG